MNWIDVVGPLKSKAEAVETMRALGEANHAVYSRNDGQEWFVERNVDMPSSSIFGMSWEEIQNKQMKRG